MWSKLTHLDLFSGIGGFSLAAEWAGFTTIGFVEKDEYCQKVLKKHWPNVPIVGDIRDVKGIKRILADAVSQPSEVGGHDRTDAAEGAKRRDNEGRGGGHDCGKPRTQEDEANGIKEIATYTDRASESSSPINEGKGRGQLVQKEEGQDGESPVTLITGGFPCQSFSVAGKRRGEADDRYLWPEMFRVIEEVRPRWVLAENVAGIIPMALDTVLSDLVGAGYTTEAVVIPACAVNAPHRRDRVWIVAYSERTQRRWGRIPDFRPNRTEDRERTPDKPCRTGQDVADTKKPECQQSRDTRPRRTGLANSSEDIANTEGKGLEGADTEGDSRRTGCPAESEQGRWQGDWWAVEPELGRVAHGIPHRVDRLRCLGNAIVPQVAYEILRGIAEIEQV